MPYYIYENWSAQHPNAVLHDGECVYCRDGKAAPFGLGPEHGKWDGLFEELSESAP